MSKKAYVKWDKRPEEDDYVLYKGKIRKVNAVEENFWFNGNIIKVNLCGARADDFVDSECVQVMRKLKPGDKVKVIAANMANEKYKNGDVLTFKEVFDWRFNTICVEETARILFIEEVEYYEKPKIDYRTSEGAFGSLEDAIDKINKNMHRVQLRSAVAEMLVEVLDNREGLKEVRCENAAHIYSNKSCESTRIHTNNEAFESYKSPNDEWDTLTGVYVALCKATGKKPVLAY